MLLFSNIGKSEIKNGHTFRIKLHPVVMRSTASVSKLRFIVLEQRHYSRWCSHGIDAELDRESKSTWREIDYCDKNTKTLIG